MKYKNLGRLDAARFHWLGAFLGVLLGDACVLPDVHAGTTDAETPGSNLTWRGPEQWNSGTAAGALLLAMDETGNALAAWDESSGVAPAPVRAKSFEVGKGWGESTIISEDVAGATEVSDLAADGTGDFIVLIGGAPVNPRPSSLDNFINSSAVSTFAKTREANGTWGAAAQIDAASTESVLATNGSGGAIAVAGRRVVEGNLVLGWTLTAVRYVPGEGWGASTAVASALVGPDATGAARASADNEPVQLAAAIDRSGAALVVWTTIGGDVWSADLGAGLPGTAQRLEAAPVGPAGTNLLGAVSPVLEQDDAGNAIAVWGRDDADSMSIQWSQFSRGSGWSTPRSLVSNEQENYFKPAMAMDPNGNAILVWRQLYEMKQAIWYSRYAADSGWEKPAPIEPTTRLTSADDPAIAIDGAGNAIAAWADWGGNDADATVQASRYRPGHGWERSVSVSSNAELPEQVAISVGGPANGIVTWRERPQQSQPSVYWINRFE
jgi:hypothetical protein